MELRYLIAGLTIEKEPVDQTDYDLPINTNPKVRKIPLSVSEVETIFQEVTGSTPSDTTIIYQDDTSYGGEPGVRYYITQNELSNEEIEEIRWRIDKLTNSEIKILGFRVIP